MKRFPIPPMSLWLGSRDGFANYKSYQNADYANANEPRLPTAITVQTNESKPVTTIVNIPETIWEAGKLPPSSTDYAEAAIVHAQLLARPGRAHGVAIDERKAKEVATLNDTAETIRSIRARLWSIPLSEATQAAVYRLVCDISARIEDPVGRATVLLRIFPNVPEGSRNVGPPKDSLARLPIASEAIGYAMGYALHVNDRSRGYREHLAMARRRLDFGLFERLGVSGDAMRVAQKIDRGFDLMTVGMTIGWMRKVHEEGDPKYSFETGEFRQFELGYMPGQLRRLEGIYGWKEIADPALRRVNELYIRAAIKRMTDYKKGLQKRQAKVTQV